MDTVPYWNIPLTPQGSAGRLDGIQALDTHGIKISIEKGWNQMGGKYARHSSEILQAIKQESDKRNLPIHVHATCEENQTTVLKPGVHTLAHPLISKQKKISDEFVKLMKQTDTYQMNTLTAMDAELTYYNTERLDDPLLALSAPKVELATTKDIQKRRLAFSTI